MKLWVLGSGSRGNAFVLEEQDTRVLIDAGFPPRVLASRMARAGIVPESISAVVITHEHTDHVRGAAGGVRRWRWSMHASAGTVASCQALRDSGAQAWAPEEILTVGSLRFEMLPVPHDAAEPIGVVATSERSGARCGVAYDLGRAGSRLRGRLRELDMLVLEANHDRTMLRNGPYPRSVQARIAGPNGHLSNDTCADVARDVSHGGLQHLVMAHISEQCNEPSLVLDAMRGALKGGRFRGRVQLTTQDRVVGPLALAPRPAVQLGLGF